MNDLNPQRRDESELTRRLNDLDDHLDAVFAAERDNPRRVEAFRAELARRTADSAHPGVLGKAVESGRHLDPALLPAYSHLSMAGGCIVSLVISVTVIVLLSQGGTLASAGGGLAVLQILLFMAPKLRRALARRVHGSCGDQQRQDRAERSARHPTE